MMKLYNLSHYIISTLCIVLLFSGCATYQPGNLEQATRGFNLISVEEEIAVGHEYTSQFEAQHEIITDPRVQNYIDELGQKLVWHSRRTDIDYHFKVVDTDEVNACAYPGGFVYVFRGLIEVSENEAQLAGVIAHEIGHAAAKHGAQQITQNLLVNLGVTVLDELTEDEKNKELIALASTLLVQGYLMQYSRTHERQADDLAAETLYKAGYDPEAWIHLLEGLEKGSHSPSSIEKLFATHPETSERVVNVATLSSTFAPGAFTKDTPEFQQIKRILTGKEPVLSESALDDSQELPSEGYIPLLEAEVTALKFFESGDAPLSPDQRRYNNRFPQSTARIINWELHLEHPEPGIRIDFEIEAVWYSPDGSVMARQTLDSYIESAWTYSYHNYGGGWKEAGHWPPGSYRVELFIEGEKIASGSFEIY